MNAVLEATAPAAVLTRPRIGFLGVGWIGRNRMVRNAAIAAGNSGKAELVPVLERLVGDEDPVVAEAAQWAVSRLLHREPEAR